ncbi:MAG: CDP-archaeol synthase [Candidatus Liberibacter ctenarytainae]|uniref:Phosphatidate cytidylyltransferase n=1 Tax=Candidatus Liberibacter ctenarytainae TaxID=2020335 RepID=A0A937AEP0_9HYPH|nr:CDP-archaeol synthase [Candidatus Liberibacter ctenarytainae]
MSQELKQRVVTGFLIACVFVLASCIGGVLFCLLVLAMGLCIYYEWSNITNSFAISFGEKILGSLVFCFVSYMTIVGFLKEAVILLVLYAAVDLFFSIVKKRSLWNFLGILYSGLPAIAMVSLRGDGVKGFMAIIFVLSVVWSTDVFAYFIGRCVGGPKIAPRISPGKTWSGSIGGFFCSIIVGVSILSYFLSGGLQSAIVLSTIISISCQLGDLFESFVKRCFCVKQSGWFLPGHGGIMDRVDGLVFACLIISIFNIQGIEIFSLDRLLI